MNIFRILSISLAIAAMLPVLPIPAWGGSPETPRNKIAVIVDCSGSFRERRQQAVEQTLMLLAGMSESKMKRWEGETDEVYLIALDALPQVIWKGTYTTLKSADLKEVVKLFSVREEFSSCTDVTGAFQLALQHLTGDPRYVGKYLFVFSDLIHEPPVASVTACGPAVYLPGRGDFPWDLLKDVSVTVFWMPANQMLRWEKAAAENGLSGQMTFHAAGVSGQVQITPPPKPREKISHEEREARALELKGKLVGWGRMIGMAILCFMGVMILLGAAAAIFRKARTRRTTPPGPGGIPPMSREKIRARRPVNP